MARTSFVRSLLTLLGGIIAVVVIIGGILIVGFDLRVELAGGALRPRWCTTPDRFVRECRRPLHDTRAQSFAAYFQAPSG